MEKKVTSVGAVVVNSKNEFLLLLARKSVYWNFPKGHMEGQEDELDTMRREVEEESGIKNFTLIEGFREVEDYAFTRDGYKSNKIAILYLIRTDDPVEINLESREFRWVDYETALEMVKYDAQREIIKKAYAFITKK